MATETINFTVADRVVLSVLQQDIHKSASTDGKDTKDELNHVFDSPAAEAAQAGSGKDVAYLKSLNNAADPAFEPTVIVGQDLRDMVLAKPLAGLLNTYIHHARKIVRVETDVVMLTHLLLYFTTLVPSAILLFNHFIWIHGVLHWLMQSYFIGTYTLMMHQHIHMGGILNRKFALLDRVFPYITDPLMGHTWNSYYYHHVKHHHVEGNGPDDLSSTIRFQRDSKRDFALYVGRFLLLVWFELPLYFIKKGKFTSALKASTWELGTYLAIYLATKYLDWRAALFVLILPLCCIRIGLMVGNWGQHALVDEIEPDSDYRSSITLIDIASNRFCFNDGYHTSHHLNSRRHWRDHPVSFLEQRQKYAAEGALVFTNIDYIMMTIKVLQKDYQYLAKCMIPIGDEQLAMTMDERAEHLRKKTRKFSEEEIKLKFKGAQH